MGDFISEQVIKHFNPKISAIGTINSFDLENGGLAVVVRLNGEQEPVRITFDQVTWESVDGQLRLHYERVTASRPWIQGLLDLLAEKRGKFFEIKDKMSLYPLRMIFRKRGEADA